jgi:hypothetical protein
VERKGFLQQHVFSKLGYYPWECSECREICLRHTRGVKKRKKSGRSMVEEPAEDAQQLVQDTVEA